MKKIKIYIVTYNDGYVLNKNLDSLFSEEYDDNISVFIINNHSNFNIENKFHDKITILHNMVRPDFSRGHLSRNWNQAIINGFKDLNDPDCDILITCQDDIIWNNNWLNDLKEIHKTYSFYTGSGGDCMCSYLPESIKKIGLWDERFNGICFHEADFFLRAFIYNKDRSSINDIIPHGRELNPTKHIVTRSAYDREHNGRTYSHDYCEKLYNLKWNPILPSWKNSNMNDVPTKSKILDFIIYSYFEKDVELFDKNYFI